jgi:hypothetical protein
MPLTTLPVFAKSWTQAGNTIVTPQSTALLQAAQTFVSWIGYMLALPAPGWTCNGSSDGTTAAIDGVNRITSTAKVVCSSGGNRSWIQLTQTATGMQIVLEFKSATGATFLEGRVSPGGLFTGGSLTAGPTATDSSIFKTTSTSWLADSTGIGRFNVGVWHSTDGTVTHVAISCANTLLDIATFGSAQDPVPGWTTPYGAMMIGATALTNTRLHTTDIYTANNVWWTKSGSTAMGLRFTFEAQSFKTLPALADTKVYAGVNGARLICQPGLYSLTTGVRGRHGRMCDFWLGSSQVGFGTISQDPAAPSRTVVHLGGVVLPWALGSARYAG